MIRFTDNYRSTQILGARLIERGTVTDVLPAATEALIVGQGKAERITPDDVTAPLVRVRDGWFVPGEAVEGAPAVDAPAPEPPENEPTDALHVVETKPGGWHLLSDGRNVRTSDLDALGLEPLED